MSEEEARPVSIGEWMGLIAVGIGALALLIFFPMLANSMRQALDAEGALSQLNWLQSILISPIACVSGGIAATLLFAAATRARFSFVMRRVLATTSLLIVFIFVMTFRQVANIVIREGRTNEAAGTRN